MKLFKVNTTYKRDLFINIENISYVQQSNYPQSNYPNSCCDKGGRHDKVYTIYFSGGGYVDVCDCTPEAIVVVERMIHLHSRGIE